jgi:cytochrome c5
MKYLIKIILLGMLASLANTMMAADNQTPKKPVNNNDTSQANTTTGFLQEFTEKRVHHGKDRSGKEIYEFRCKACHAKNTQGAPMPDDNFEWGIRLKQKGIKPLLRHAMEGYNNTLMPAKGGCRDCNRAEVYASVYYMLKLSGNEVKRHTNKKISKN